MITLKDFFEVTEYRVTETSDYLWSCFGNNAQSMDYWNQDHDGHSVCIVFDRLTQTVYSFEVADYSRDRAYRYINPEYAQAHRDEVVRRNIDDNAWDDVPWTDIEVEEDILEKARAIVSGQEYDTRVQVPIDLADSEWFKLMRMAHDRDITLNQLVEQILVDVINQKREVVEND